MGVACPTASRRQGDVLKKRGIDVQTTIKRKVNNLSPQIRDLKDLWG
jgi:hypothetical protein